MVATTVFAANPAKAQDTRDCLQLRLENGWTRAQFRQCKMEEGQKRLAELNAEFEAMRDWLRARGLDLNDAGFITDAKGRTLAQIEASNAELEAGNAALRAETQELRLRTIAANEEYEQILREFSQAVLGSN